MIGACFEYFLKVVDISANEIRKKIANNFSYFFRPMGPIILKKKTS